MDKTQDETLVGYRRSIDNIDAALVLLLAERFKITNLIGTHKANLGLPAEDTEREREQVARLRRLAADAGLDQSFSENFLRFVIKEVIRRHTLALNDNCRDDLDDSVTDLHTSTTDPHVCDDIDDSVTDNHCDDAKDLTIDTHPCDGVNDSVTDTHISTIDTHH